MIETMDPDMHEMQDDYYDDEFTNSEELSVSSDSSGLSFIGRNRGKTQHRNGLRSIKLSRLSSVKRTMKWDKSRSVQLFASLSGGDSSSEQSPPNYMKATSCADAKRETFQKSGSLPGLSSLKFRKKRLKKSRSIRPSKTGKSGFSDDLSCNSEVKQSMPVVPGKSVRVLARKSSMKPVRILAKTGTRKVFMRKCSEGSQLSDSNIRRATCSSALRDKPGDESVGNGVKKVCTYSYCSLHGHRHGTLPPLKRFVSMRRRTQKNQKKKNMKAESQPPLVAVRSNPVDELTDGNGAIDAGQSNLLEKQKYMGLWRLIYQHMVSDDVATDETRIGFDEENEGKEKENRSKVIAIENENGGAITNAGSQEIEFNQIDAIRLVQEAIDSILRPGIGEDSDQKLDAKETCEDGEDSADDKVGESEETKIEEDDKATSVLGKRLNLQTSKNWSKLKRVILVKRFVKAMERVRNINPQKLRFLPLEPDPEAEKVQLRRQTTEERKNGEEWMLDYALRQVISKLDSAQKKRVSLLVDAFEMVTPAHETEFSPRMNTFSPRQKPVRAYTNDLVQNGEECEPVLLKQDNEVTIPEHKQTSFEYFCTKTEQDAAWKKGGVVASNYDNVDKEFVHSGDKHGGPKVSDEFQEVREVHEETIPISNSGSCNGDPDSSGAIHENGNVTGVEHFDTSTRPTPEKNEGKNGEAKAEFECLQGSPPIGESEPECPTDVAHETQPKIPNQLRMWHLIYKHMASDIAENETQQPLPDAAKKEEEKTDNGSNLLGSNMNHLNASNQKTEQRKIEAIKLVKEAIDKILLPEMEDTPPKQDEDTVKNPDSPLLDAEENVPNSHNTTNEEAAKAVITKPNSWSNLKKLLLLKRFIKALEKVKKINPREPRHLQMETDPEAEKVNLKHKDMEERKGAEEWMLDYALQQVVSQLNPVRKRKVKLLVEAFETVIPTMGT